MEYGEAYKLIHWALLRAVQDGERLGVRAETRAYTDDHLSDSEESYVQPRAAALTERLGFVRGLLERGA